MRNGTGPPNALWHKSSYSNGTGNCREAARPGGGRAATRDSEDPAGPARVFGAAARSAFVTSVAEGEFDRR